MANVIAPDELGKNQNNQIGQQGNNANQAGQAPAEASGNAPAITSSQTNNPNKQTGSGYTNIQKVINANKGNQLGSAVGNNIQQVGSAAQNNLKAAQNQFSQDTAQNQFNTTDNQQLAQNALNDPNAVANNQQDVSKFQNLLSGQYQGPTGLNNADQLQSQAQNVAQMGQALNTSGGRVGLLHQLVGNPQYTAGQANLDNLLLGQSQSPEIQAAKRQALTLQGKVGSAVQGAAAQGQQQQNQASAFGQSLQNQLGQNVSGQEQTLQQKAIDQQNQQNQLFSNIQKQAADGQISPEIAQALGIQAGQQSFGIDASKFLSQNPNAATEQNVASSQDYAKMQALQKLAGQFANPDTSAILNKFQDPSQAGQFANNPAYTTDQSGFQKAYQASQNDYNSRLGSAQQGVQSAQQLQRLGSAQFNDQDKAEAAKLGIPVTQLAATKYPGAINGGGIRSDWAAGNLSTAQQQLKNVQDQLNQAYGSGVYNVGNSSYPSLANMNNLEKIPGVS